MQSDFVVLGNYSFFEDDILIILKAFICYEQLLFYW